MKNVELECALLDEIWDTQVQATDDKLVQIDLKLINRTLAR